VKGVKVLSGGTFGVGVAVRFVAFTEWVLPLPWPVTAVQVLSVAGGKAGIALV